MLNGLQKPASGVITYPGLPSSSSSPSFSGTGTGTEDVFADPSVAMMLPQRPVPAPGPLLWHQVVYPLTRPPCDPTIIHSLLSSVGLGHIVDRYDGGVEVGNRNIPTDWVGTLSPGEMQRLCIARVLYHCPRLVLLDEPCSAMDDGSAREMLELLKGARRLFQGEGSGMAVVTVAQQTDAYLALHSTHISLS